MVQTIRSEILLSMHKKIMFEKPLVLQRIFFGIKVLTAPTSWRRSLISFDDPTFASHYVLDGPVQEFEAKGEGIFQGTIWAHNASPVDIIFVMTEILI